MPAWPTLWPGLIDGKSNERIDTRPKDIRFTEGREKDRATINNLLNLKKLEKLF